MEQMAVCRMDEQEVIVNAIFFQFQRSQMDVCIMSKSLERRRFASYCVVSLCNWCTIFISCLVLEWTPEVLVTS